MRRFSSYGPVDPNAHYYAPRKELIEMAYTQLVGHHPQSGGHYITVWAPRQTGKTWLMQEVVQKIKKEKEYETVLISMEPAKEKETEEKVLDIFIKILSRAFDKSFPKIREISDVMDLFTEKYFSKPVILIIDEFDALSETFINNFAGIFRDMFIRRKNERDIKSKDKRNLLHGLALVGVRSVLGIENVTGSPFNVQRSLHIPNLFREEVIDMFEWYEKESGQKVDREVIERLYYETGGQPGLTCWFGELLTETYNREKDKPIAMDNFEETYAAATYALPNNNILNIISKVKHSPYREWVLALFKTDEKIGFRFDDSETGYLYMNGVIDMEQVGRTDYYVRFASPFVQKRLFNYFANDLFDYLGRLVEPFETLDGIFDESGLNVPNLLKCYNRYLIKNREWLLKEAPRRKDLRIYEAVFHFNLYMYLAEFLKSKGGKVYPEFPTGNGKIDLIITFEDRVYGLELKSFSHEPAYKDALRQAAQYGKRLDLADMYLVFFVEAIDETSRKQYEKDCPDEETGVMVKPIFIETGR